MSKYDHIHKLIKYNNLCKLFNNIININEK